MKIILQRNDLLLTNDYEEQFGEITVLTGDGCAIIQTPVDDHTHRWHFIDTDDAERFAQAILIHSGACKVA